MRRWFKLWLRKNSPRMPIARSRTLKQNLATFYAFFAWNATALSVYYLTTTSYPMTEKEKKESAYYYARLYQEGDIKVINVDGWTVTDTFDIKEIPELEPHPEEFSSLSPESTDETPELVY